MAVGYVPEWISLLAAIEHVQRIAGGTLEAAWEALRPALRERVVMARFRGEEVVASRRPSRVAVAKFQRSGGTTQ
jgi:hypothetical protein